MKFSAKFVTGLILLFLVQMFFTAAQAQLSSSEDEAIKHAKSLVSVINQYRREQGLNEIPYSPWLTFVARSHVYDMEVNNPYNGSCSQHSWSNKGIWSSCCYDLSSPDGECMWNKPRELSKGAYKSNGFEVGIGPGEGITNQIALEGWKNSKHHLDVILNRGDWARFKWKAIGAGISNNYAFVWFGEDADASDTPQIELSTNSSCGIESTLRSKESTSPLGATFTLINQSNVPIVLYWLNYQGQRVKYAEVKPNSQIEQKTYLTHPWVVTDPNGKCLRALEAPGSFIIK